MSTSVSLLSRPPLAPIRPTFESELRTCKQGTRNGQQVFLIYWKRRLAVGATKGYTSIIA